LDAQLAELKERLAAVVAASGTTTTKIFGVGPVVAAITVGLTRDVRRFADKDHFAAYNGSAPIEVSSGQKKIYRLSMRGSRQLNHASTWRPSLRSASLTPRAVPTSTARWPRARLVKKPSGRSNAASAMPSMAPWPPTPAGRKRHQVAREGKRGTAN